MPLFTFPLAFIALTAAGGLAAVYLLRNRFKRHTVSSLMLWTDHRTPRDGGARVQRIQTPWLFLLEMLTILLLVLAATGPRFMIGYSQRPLVVILDDSYSMIAGSDDDSPRNRAIDAIIKQLKNQTGYQTRFVLAGPSPQLLGDPIENFVQIKPLLENWHPQAASSNLSEAISFATDLVGSKSRLLVITDHLPKHEVETGRLQWWAFGKKQNNLAIVNAARSITGNKERLLIEVANFSDKKAQANITITQADTSASPIKKTLTLSPGQIDRYIADLPDSCPTITIRLQNDVLSVDNQVTLLSQKPKPIRVDLRIDDPQTNDAITQALEATGRVKLTAVKADLMMTDSTQVNMTGLHRWIVQLLREEKPKAWIGPYVIDRDHPLTEGIELQGTIWGAGQSSDMPGRPIITAGNTPLVTDTTRPNGRHDIRIRFHREFSTLQRSPNWPILFWNLLRWRETELPGFTENNIHLDTQARLTLKADVEQIKIIDPAGKAIQLPVRDRVIGFRASQVGLYQVQTTEQTYSLAVNALSREESDLTQTKTEKQGSWLDEQSLEKEYRSIAWLLILTALGLLVWHQWLVWKQTASNEIMN